MKKSAYIILMVFLMCIAAIPVSAAHSKMSGPNRLEVGSSGNVLISSPPGGWVRGNVKSSDPSVVSISMESFSAGPGTGQNEVATQTLKITAKKPGTVVITANVEGETLLDGFKETLTLSVTVSEKASDTNNSHQTKPQRPSPSEKTPPKNQSSTGEKEAIKGNKEEVNNTSVDEESQRKAEEKKRQEEEAKQKQMLIKRVSFISMSEKLKGEEVSSVDIVQDKFDYEVSLPKRINETKLKIEADEGVELSFNDSVSFSDDEDSKVIEIKATKENVEKFFQLKVNKSKLDEALVSFDEEDFKVYDDDLLDAYMKEKGFDALSFDRNDQKVPYFSKGSLSVQLLYNDEMSFWVLLDEDFSPIDKGILHIDKDGHIYFILDHPDEELRSKTLNDEVYSEKEYVYSHELQSIDSSLNLLSKYKSWLFEDGEVVYAYNDSMLGRLYFMDDDIFDMAVVAFDRDAKLYKYWSYGTSILILTSLSTYAWYTLIYKKKL